MGKDGGKAGEMGRGKGEVCERYVSGYLLCIGEQEGAGKLLKRRIFESRTQSWTFGKLKVEKRLFAVNAVKSNHGENVKGNTERGVGHCKCRRPGI